MTTYAAHNILNRVCGWWRTGAVGVVSVGIGEGQQQKQKAFYIILYIYIYEYFT